MQPYVHKRIHNIGMTSANHVFFICTKVYIFKLDSVFINLFVYLLVPGK